MVCGAPAGIVYRPGDRGFSLTAKLLHRVEKAHGGGAPARRHVQHDGHCWGTGYAALRVHDSLCLAGANSTLYVGRAERSRHPGVMRLRDAEEGCQPPLVPGMTIFSVDAPGIPDSELEQIIGRADVFNLHWYARFLSVRNIERLSRSGKPVVLTVRDMNPLAGGCHFFHGCENWKRDCLPCPQFLS